MKRPYPDIGELLQQSYTARLGTLRKMIRYWGTTFVNEDGEYDPNGTEVLTPRRGILPAGGVYLYKYKEPVEVVDSRRLIQAKRRIETSNKDLFIQRMQDEVGITVTEETVDSYLTTGVWGGEYFGGNGPNDTRSQGVHDATPEQFEQFTKFTDLMKITDTLRKEDKGDARAVWLELKPSNHIPEDSDDVSLLDKIALRDNINKVFGDWPMGVPKDLVVKGSFVIGTQFRNDDGDRFLSTKDLDNMVLEGEGYPQLVSPISDQTAAINELTNNYQNLWDKYIIDTDSRVEVWCTQEYAFISGQKRELSIEDTSTGKRWVELEKDTRRFGSGSSELSIDVNTNSTSITTTLGSDDNNFRLRLYIAGTADVGVYVNGVLATTILSNNLSAYTKHNVELPVGLFNLLEANTITISKIGSGNWFAKDLYLFSEKMLDAKAYIVEEKVKLATYSAEDMIASSLVRHTLLSSSIQSTTTKIGKTAIPYKSDKLRYYGLLTGQSKLVPGLRVDIELPYQQVSINTDIIESIFDSTKVGVNTRTYGYRDDDFEWVEVTDIAGKIFQSNDYITKSRLYKIDLVKSECDDWGVMRECNDTVEVVEYLLLGNTDYRDVSILSVMGLQNISTTYKNVWIVGGGNGSSEPNRYFIKKSFFEDSSIKLEDRINYFVSIIGSDYSIRDSGGFWSNFWTFVGIAAVIVITIFCTACALGFTGVLGALTAFTVAVAILSVATMVLQEMGMTTVADAFSNSLRMLAPFVMVASMIIMINGIGAYIDKAASAASTTTATTATDAAANYTIDRAIDTAVDYAADMANKIYTEAYEYVSDITFGEALEIADRLFKMYTDNELKSMQRELDKLRREAKSYTRESVQNEHLSLSAMTVPFHPLTALESVYAGIYDRPYETCQTKYNLCNVQASTVNALWLADENPLDKAYEKTSRI